MNANRWFAIVSMLIAVLCSPLRAEEEALYLHCFFPTTWQKVGRESSPDEPSEGTPPTRAMTLKVVAGSDFEVLLEGHHHVSGRVIQKEGAFAIALEGAFRSGFAFSGNVELESVFDPEITWFSGAMLTPRCVLSKHKEIEPFLKAQAAADAERRKKISAEQPHQPTAIKNPDQ